MSVTLFHNPRCSKSRATKALLEARGIDFETVLYLQEPLDPVRLAAVISRLNLAPAAAVRDSDDAFGGSGLDLTHASAAEIAKAVVRAPRLLQRPIVDTGREARIGRPPEAVLDIL